MKKTHLIIIMAVLTMLSVAIVRAEDNAEGAINPELIAKMRESAKYDGAWRAIYNSLLGNDIKKLALDQDKVRESQDLFNVTLKTKGVTNQKSSGRCWLFSSLNFMRPMLIEKYKLNEFEFSQNYLAFWDKLEKANKFLEVVIEMRDRDPLDRELWDMMQHPWGDGGWWFYVVELIEKYGCVPSEAMPESQSSSNTGMMNNIISTKLRKCAAELRSLYSGGAGVEQLRSVKEEMLVDIYRMLTLNLGVPPTEFTWRFEDTDTAVSEPKVYTPLEFYHDVVGIDLKNYVTISDHPSRPKFQMYTARLSRDMYDKPDRPFMNMPIDTLKAYALRMLLDNQPVVFACDVGKDNFNDEGIFRVGIYDFESLYGTDLGMDKSTRFTYGDLTTNHMMLLTACDTIGGIPVKWKVENSWGTERGDGGYWTMYDDWFDEYVFEVIVDSKLLSKDMLNILKKEPIELPYWDPYSEFRH